MIAKSTGSGKVSRDTSMATTNRFNTIPASSTAGTGSGYTEGIVDYSDAKASSLVRVSGSTPVLASMRKEALAVASTRHLNRTLPNELQDTQLLTLRSLVRLGSHCVSMAPMEMGLTGPMCSPMISE